MWKAFLESLDSPGGHIVVLTGLLLVGIGMHKLGVPKSDDVIVGSFAVLLALLRPGGKAA